MDFFPLSPLKGEGYADMSKRIHSDFIPNWSQSFPEFQVLGDKVGFIFSFPLFSCLGSGPESIVLQTFPSKHQGSAGVTSGLGPALQNKLCNIPTHSFSPTLPPATVPSHLD